MKELQMISVSHLHPHPDNPRKNLGDLTELRDSIKANGLLQNLTVVPFTMTDEEYAAACEDYRKNPTAEKQELINRVSSGSAQHYVVIIGHRRLAAAKEAGLSTVPCAVVEMTPQEQIETMLTENMQRTDLTVIEQAEGIQMVLDLGISVKDLAKNTGFSESTIRRRKNLLKLDRKELEAAEGRGGTLKDYIELEKIKDKDRRNEVLKTIGTSNFGNRLMTARDEEKTIEGLMKVEKEIAAFAQKIAFAETEGKKYIRTFYRWYYDELHVPDKDDTSNYYYTVDNEGTIDMDIRLYTDLPEETEEEQEKDDRCERAEEWLEKMDHEDKAASERFYQLRKDFVSKLSQKEIQSNLYTAIITLLNNIGKAVNGDIYNIMGLEVNDTGYAIYVKDEEQLERYINIHEYKALFLFAWGKIDNYHRKSALHDWDEDYEDGKYIIERNKNNLNGLVKVYEFLEDFGYETSDEENDYLGGVKYRNLREAFEMEFPGMLADEDDDEEDDEE